MTPIRRLARPLLAAPFVTGGIETLCNPEGRVKKAEPVTTTLSRSFGLPDDTIQLVQLNAVVQVGAGSLLAIGKFPRLASIALCSSIIPTTIAGHRFWDESEPASRAQQRIHFVKNLAILGGLLLAALDTEGAPSLSWRAKRAATKARRAAKARHTAKVVSKLPNILPDPAG
jgi:putative oxidoreductase